jgi:hypothetical protein
MFIFGGHPEEYNLRAAPDVPIVHPRTVWQSAAVAAGLMLFQPWPSRFSPGCPRRMMKLLKIACLLLSLPLIAIGGEGLYHAARNRQPVVLTCEQYVQNPPRALWLRISGCYVDYMNVGYQELNGRIVELFFPVRVPGQPSAPAPLIAATRDPEALAIVQNTVASGQPPDQESFLVSMLRIVTKLRVSREVEGYARSGVLEVWRMRAALSGLKVPLAQQFAVVDLHARPSLVAPGIETGAGVLFMGIALLLRPRRPIASAPARQPRSAEAPTSWPVLEEPIEFEEEDSTPEEPAVPPPRRLPAVMLLNLDASADATAIEHAPPIGNRAEAARHISNAVGAVEVDGNGRATARGPGWSLALDLGRQEPVWAITAEARGDGSVRALQTLARATSWRLFIPKLGGFVAPSDLGKVQKP